MKVSEVIRKAITHIEAGWCRFALDDDQGNVCMRGAVNKVALGQASWFDGFVVTTPEQRALCSRADKALSAAVQELDLTYINRLGEVVPATNLVQYNNYIARDKHDVMNLMEKVAIQHEERGE